MAKGCLPISYDALNTEEKSAVDSETINRFGPLGENTAAGPSAASLCTEDAHLTPYLWVVTGLVPSGLISDFIAFTSPLLQESVQTAICGVIWKLPQPAFATKTIMPCMFKNPEYRASLSQGLGIKQGPS